MSLKKRFVIYSNKLKTKNPSRELKGLFIFMKIVLGCKLHREQIRVNSQYYNRNNDEYCQNIVGEGYFF